MPIRACVLLGVGAASSVAVAARGRRELRRPAGRPGAFPPLGQTPAHWSVRGRRGAFYLSLARVALGGGSGAVTAVGWPVVLETGRARAVGRDMAASHSSVPGRRVRS
jgi:hypothetical protein